MSDPKPNANVPQIPQPLADVGALAVTARFLKQGMDSLAGYRGKPNDRAVTFSDLLSLGLVANTGVATTLGVTAIVAGSGLAGGTITGTGTISLGTIPGGHVMANPSGSDAVPVGVSVGSGLSLSIGGTLSSTAVVPRGYIAGLTLSNDGGTPNTIIDISAGMTTSDDATTVMSLGAFTKTTGSWAVGTSNGGLDTGAVGASTWYHIYVIERVDTGVVDVLLSTSATSPTMPTNYTKKRRIGSIKTDGSSHILAFVQTGDRFDWGTPIATITTTPGVTTAVTYTMITPLGVATEAILTGNLNDAAAGAGLYLSNLAQADLAFASAAITAQASQNVVVGWGARIVTNTSSQIRGRVSSTTTAILITTNGWIDTRGQYA